jgi:hypothetical protein
MKASDLFILGAVGIGLYYLYRTLSAASAGVNSATCAVSSGIANVWNSLTLGCNIQLSGNVVFPNGAQVAINSLPVRSDCAGNVYVQYQGGVYQLSPSNSCGNWPAIQIS